MNFRKLIAGMLMMFSSFMLKATFPTLHFEHLNTSNGLSNNRVYDIFQDRKGFLWFATLDGLNRYDGYSFLTFKNIPGDSLSLHDNRVLFIYEDANGYLWLGSRQNGLSRFDPKNETFKRYMKINNSKLTLKDIDVSWLELDKENNLIAYSYGHKLKYDSVSDSFSIIEKGLFPPPEPKESEQIEKRILEEFGLQVSISKIVKERKFKWICTERNGLFILKESGEKQVLAHYEQAPFDNKVETKCIFKDNAGTVWVSTKNRGVFKHTPESRCFEHHSSFNINGKILKDITVRAITEDSQGNIWIGTYNYGLIKYIRKENRYVQYAHKNNDSSSLPNNMVRSLYTDVTGNVWVGSYAGVSLYDEDKDCFINFLPKYSNESTTEVDDKDHLFFSRVYNFANDHFGDLWIANWEGLSKFNIKTQEFKHYPKSYFGVDNIRKVFVDRNNTVWVGCEYGGVVQLNPLTGAFTHYLPENNASSLAHQNIFSVYESKDGTIWIATFNGLSKLDRHSGLFTTYTNKDGLVGNMVYGILEDSKGLLWLTTASGLSIFDTREETFTNFNEKRGLQNNEFTEGAFYKSKLTGEMIVGGINGFNIFHPDSVGYNTVPPNIVLTKLKIFNETVAIGGDDSVLKQGICYTKNIILNYKDKIVSFEFSGLHYAIPEQNLYRYRLKGFDDKWVEVGHDRRFATYTNLPNGKYTFQVMAANCDKIWSKPIDILHVTVLPPIWKKWWAFCLYAAIIVLLLLAYRKYSLYSLQIKNELKLERIKREKSDELNKMKLDFFTNVSHEFRTPLSLILSPLENLLQVAPNSYIGSYKEKLKIINNNAQRLLRLTNQILDLRKLEMGRVDILAQETPLVLFSKHVALNFKELAAHRGIDFQFEQPDKEIFVWIDRDKFEKVLYNLISNALKFSHDETGQIRVTISHHRSFSEYSGFYTGKTLKGEYISISVEDNGIGIPKDVIKKIFQQFYRVDNSQTLPIQGSGIGLALVKELVNLHGGGILVDSTLNIGSKFSVLLPLGNKHLLPNQIKTLPKGLPLQDAYETDFNNNEIFNKLCSYSNKHKESAPTILVVEDNDELRTYICSLLNQTYNIIEAANGHIGLNIALEKFPDLIISDIMMPIKNGIELCNAIKNDMRTSHIPVILLTAKTIDEQRIEGYQSGADDYVIKPFNTQVLLLRIRNLLESKKQLQNFIKEHKKAPLNTSELKLSPIDSDFLERINKIIRNNLSDFTFNVEELSKQIGMSRSNLHIKLKALTSQSASEYIRSQKLAFAEKILKGQLKSVSEVAYEAGFNTPSYFIKCFKEKYGITPKEYMGNLN